MEQPVGARVSTHCPTPRFTPSPCEGAEAVGGRPQGHDQVGQEYTQGVYGSTVQDTFRFSRYTLVRSGWVWGQLQAAGQPQRGRGGRGGRLRLKGRDASSSRQPWLGGPGRGQGCPPVRTVPLGGRRPCRGGCAGHPGESAAPRGRPRRPGGRRRARAFRRARAAVVQGAAVAHPPPDTGLARGEAVVLAHLQGRAPRHVPLLVVAPPAAVIRCTPKPKAVQAHRSSVGAAQARVTRRARGGHSRGGRRRRDGSFARPRWAKQLKGEE